MRRFVKYPLLFLIILLAGGLVRFIRPGSRVMHTDEAVNAHKVGMLLETGVYRYDRSEYHGPVLYYFSLVTSRLSGHDSYASLQESTLRFVPALFSLLTVLLLIILRRNADWRYILTAGGLMAMAPMLVFYGRYYIHESLLTFFSLLFILAVYRYLRERRLSWVLIAGVSAGLMHATKETFVINMAAAILALLIGVKWARDDLPARGKGWTRVPAFHWVLFLVAGTLTSMLLYSSFFANPKGIADSVTTYVQYFQRAGQDDSHIHPWYYYISLLAGPWRIDGFAATDAWLLLTAAAGFAGLWIDRGKANPVGILLFLGNYSLILLLFYSAIPYKTPWNMMQFYPGLLLLSGYAILGLFRAKWPPVLKWTLAVLVMAGGIHWGWSGMKLNFQYCDDPGNPYVYAPTSPDVREVAAMLDTLAMVQPEGYALPVEVVFPGDDYWPLPWYLRRFEHVGYYNRITFDAHASPVVIVSPSIEGDLVRKLYEVPPPGERYLYTSLSGSRQELRPGVGLQVYVRMDVWDLYHYRDAAIRRRPSGIAGYPLDPGQLTQDVEQRPAR